MERLKNIEDYKALLREYKTVCRRGYTNNFLNTELIKRYLDLQRIYYIAIQDALIFITDEEKYYRLHVSVSPQVNILDVKNMDKPLLVRNIFKEGKKTKELLSFEKVLKETGFHIYDESVQIVAYPLNLKEDIRKKYEKAAAFLARTGIHIGYAENEYNLKEIQLLRQEESVLKDYHFTYENEDEILDNMKKGYYRCAFDSSGTVCAAQQFSVENGTVQGNWLAVKEEYKVRYGIGTAMAYHSFLYACERELPTYFGWVVRDNEKSIKYHQSIGYEVTDKYADEWLLA